MKERADCMSGYRLARTYEEMGFKVIEDSIKVENGKKYADAKAVCWKCMGRGRLAHFANIEAGICFACGGNGYEFKKHCRVYTDAEREKIDAAAIAKKERELAKKKAGAAEKIATWLQKYNITDGYIYIVAGCNTYEMKDQLKELGAKFYNGVNWFFGKDTVPTEDLGNGAFIYRYNINDLFYWNDFGGGPYYIDGAIETLRQSIKDHIADMNRNASKSEYVGEVGERLRNMDATFVSAKFFEGNWGGSFVYTFKVGENVFTWFTQKVLDYEPEDKINLTGTVKAHTEYNGILQTQLSRCIIKER